MHRIDWISCNAKGENVEEKIAHLLCMLEQHTLDPTFEAYGNFADLLDDGKTCSLFGNFFDYCFVFHLTVSTDDPLFEKLNGAIKKNQSSDKYRLAKRSQSTPTRKCEVQR